MDSILTSVKKMLGIPEEHTQFDPDIIIHINTVFDILTQLGVGPDEGFSISGSDETWDSFITDQRLNMVKTYMYAKARMLFDPPTSGIVTGSQQELIKEMEWRLNVEVDSDYNGSTHCKISKVDEGSDDG